MGQFNDQLKMSAPALYGKDDDKKRKMNPPPTTDAKPDNTTSALGQLNNGGFKSASVKKMTRTITEKVPKQRLQMYSKKLDSSKAPEGQHLESYMKKQEKPGKTNVSPLGELGLVGNATDSLPENSLKVNPKYQKRVNTILGKIIYGQIYI